MGTAIDIDEAPLRLNPLTISEAYGSTATLVTPIVQHYTSQGIREAYKILGSLEILGNPVQLVGNLTEGFQDFFYEPAKGLVSSPQDFGRGLAKGTSSLLKHTLSGVFGSLSKVTGKVAEGVAVLGMDQEYQRKARMEARHPPKHIGEGLLQGGKAIFNGLFRGVTGLVTDPYHGCRRKGAKGFLQGVGTGLVGVGLKPAAGAIGAVSKILQGAGNTATLCDAQYDIEIARFPRYIGRDRVLRPYNKLDAEMAAKLNLYEITDMAIAEADRDEENYIMSIESPEGHLIVSSLRLLFLPRAAGSQKPKFSVIWEDTKSFQAVANNVLVVREGKRDPKQFKMASQADAVAAVDELLKLVPEFAEKRKRGSVAGVLGGAMRGATSVFKGAGSAVTGAVTGAFGKMFSSKKKTAEMKAAGAGSAEDVKITVTDVSVRSPDSKDKSMGSQSSGSKGALSL